MYDIGFCHAKRSFGRRGSRTEISHRQTISGHLLTRPVGRPPKYIRRYYVSFNCRAKSWDRSRQVVAKVE